MRRQHVSFEWHLVEDEAAWNTLPVQEWGAENSRLIATQSAPVNPMVNIDHRITAQLVRGLTLCLVGLILVAAVDLTPAERERRRAIRGISTLLTQETKETAVQAPSTLVSAAQVAAPIIGLVRVEPIGELTLAEVILHESPPSWRMNIPYRETRFYQETDDGWRQIRPDDLFWGTPIQRETTHLRFEFLARDAATVEPLLTQMDALYVTAHTLLGIELSAPATKLTIEITPERITGRGIYEDRVRVTSPLMAQIPNELSATTFLAHQIASRLLSLIINNQSATQTIEPAIEGSFLAQWRVMRRGLRSWLQQELLAERWPWDQQAATFFRETYQADQPLTLGVLWWGNGQQFSEPEQMMWQSAVAEAVIDYAVDTHGPAILPQLWRGFHRYETSADWVNGVFGLTVEEFEAGWNQYLAERQE